jgi:hypothetical protein
VGLKILPVVKAYPVIDPVSQTEAVCVAGISMDAPHRWIRLFPLDYRGLMYAKRFKKYEVIDLVHLRGHVADVGANGGSLGSSRPGKRDDLPSTFMAKRVGPDLSRLRQSDP